MNSRTCCICGVIVPGSVILNECGDFLCRECNYESAKHISEQTYKFHNSAYNITVASGLSGTSVIAGFIRKDNQSL
jgi:hypothetical protein